MSDETFGEMDPVELPEAAKGDLQWDRACRMQALSVAVRLFPHGMPETILDGASRFYKFLKGPEE